MAGEGSHLQRYAACFDIAEINSSFHRPHRPATYARWAEAVPEHFSFAVKLPKTISHKQRLVDSEELLAAFAAEIAGLGSKRGPLLVQLPPSFAFPGEVAERFFDAVDAVIGGQIVIEPRHASWFEPEVGAMLAERRIARVAADPAVPDGAAQPGGWLGLAYFRLHGSPRTYWSSYSAKHIAAHATALAAYDESWTIYDNTASGAALSNALDLRDRI
jgi:uncharacterized protein YecE (DUF72 family)